MRQPMTVGRRHAIPSQDVGVVRQLLRLALAIRGITPEFGLAGFRRNRQYRFSVGHVARVAITDAGISRDLHDASARGRGQGEHFAARGEHRRASIRRDVRHAEVFQRLLHPVIAQLVEIGNQRDGNDGVLIGIQVEQPEVCAALVHDAPVRERRGLHVEPAVMRVLLHVMALADPWKTRSWCHRDRKENTRGRSRTSGLCDVPA